MRREVVAETEVRSRRGTAVKSSENWHFPGATRDEMGGELRGDMILEGGDLVFGNGSKSERSKANRDEH